MAIAVYSLASLDFMEKHKSCSQFFFSHLNLGCVGLSWAQNSTPKVVKFVLAVV